MEQSIWVWTWDPTILIGLAAWTLGYIYLIGPLRRRKGWEPAIGPSRQLAFHLGTLVAFFALVSPLDHLSDDYLLSAHMVQHLLLIMGAPPLWLLGFPATWLDALIPKGFIRSAIYFLTRPVTTFIIFFTIFLGWHIPALYDAALENETVHAIEHLSFMAAAVFGWWPILGFLPKAGPRPSYPLQMAYSFSLVIPSVILAAVISFATSPIYPVYLDAPNVIGTSVATSLSTGGRLWGISVMEDQQISGLMMWVPANMMYFLAFMIIFNKWLSENERRSREKYTLEDQARAAARGEKKPASDAVETAAPK